VLTEDLAREAVTAEKLAAHAVGEDQLASEAVTTKAIAREAVGEAQLAAALRKLIPLAVGRSAEMTLGKVTIASSAVTAAGPIIVSAEGGVAIGLTVTSRKVGASFTVEATLATDARVNWAIYPE